jgi:nicotinic acid mononucleotide adenylyltransferase
VRLERVLAELEQPERVLFFDMDAHPVSSRDLRAALAAGGDVSGEVPPAVVDLIDAETLYRR